MRRIAGLILMVWIGCSLGCKNKDGMPYGILDKEKMQVVFWDMIQAEVFTNQFIKKDSSKNAILINARLQQQIFALHKITKDQFYKSYRFYSLHPELMRPLLDSITSTAERDKYKILYNKPAGPIQMPIPSLMRLPVADPNYIPMPVPTTITILPIVKTKPTYIPN